MTIFEVDPTGRMVGQIPNNPEMKNQDYSTRPDIRLALQRHQTTLSETLTLPDGTKAVSLCVPVRSKRTSTPPSRSL